MTDIFISYSRKDQQFVRRLHQSLEGNNRNAWVDWENIPLTAEWLQEIYDGIEAANAFAYIISPDSVRSEVCSLELAHALTHNKRLIPVLHRDLVEDMDKHSLDPNISSHNWIFFRETDDYDTSFKALMDALDTDLDHLRLHTRLLVRSVQWNDKERDASLVLRGNELREAVTWLEKGADKQPHPTELQKDFVHASQRAAAGRRRVVLLTSVYFAVVLILTAFAFLQAVNAEDRRQDAEEQKKIAESNFATAESAQSTAIFNEGQAQAARSTAVFNGEQAHSLALAASAQEALYRDNNSPLAIALAMAAVDTDQPPPLAGSMLAQAAYFPGTRYILPGASTDVVKLEVDAASGRGFWISDANALVMTILATGEEEFRWEGSDTVLNALAVSPDGSRVATGDAAGIITIYDIESKAQVIRWESEDIDAADDADRRILDLDFTPDSRTLVFSSASSKIRVRDIASGDIRLTFEAHTDPSDSPSLAISPDGKTVVSADDTTGVAYWWDIATGEIKQTLPQHGKAWTVAFLPDGQHVLVGYEDFTVRGYELATGTETQVLKRHFNRIWDIDVSSDGAFAVTSSYDGTIIYWNLQSGESIQVLNGHQSTVYAAKFINYRQIFSGSVDGTVRAWDIVNSAEIMRYTDHHNAIWTLKTFTNADNRLMLLSADRSGFIMIHDAETGELVKSFEFPGRDIYGVDISADQQRIIFGSNNDYVAVIDAATGTIIKDLMQRENTVTRTVALSPDGTLAAIAGNTADNKGLLQVWDIAGGEIVREFPYGDSVRVWKPVFSADGNWLLAAATDRSVILWDVPTGEEIRRFEGHTGVVYSAVFSPDEKTILSGSEDRSIRLWNTATGEEIRRFEGHSGVIYSAVFSPDGNMLLSGSADSTVRVWDIDGGFEIQRFDVPDTPVRGIAFAPDSHSVFSSSDDTVIRRWQVLTMDELMLWIADNRVVAEFTCNQQRLYQIEPLDPACLVE